MGNPADTLVSKHPTRVAQLKGPVLAYLTAISRNMPFNGTDQDLYMAVFYPAYRRKPMNMLLPDNVRRMNKPIRTAGDYVAKVNAQTHYAKIESDAEWDALKDTASKIGVSWQSLYKLINFESGWNPKARNHHSGARGLIQFMPDSARRLGYKPTLGLGTSVLIAGVGYIALKELKII